jgi:hypothetical protein
MKTLTIESATELKGKEISFINYGYKGQDNTGTFIIGEIITELEFARKELNVSGFVNRAEYWESYMSREQLEKVSTRLFLLNEKGNNTQCFCDPKFSNEFFMCDDDRNVFICE